MTTPAFYLNIFYFFISLFLVPLSLEAQTVAEFEGTPKMGINEFGVFRAPTDLTPEEQATHKVLITKKDDKYYWTSRENRELRKFESGAFVTYWTLDGSGYVRIGNEEWKSKMRVKYPQYNFDYVEHLTIGLGSLSYYGIAEK
jgi:hypothetical protein